MNWESKCAKKGFNEQNKSGIFAMVLGVLVHVQNSVSRWMARPKWKWIQFKPLRTIWPTNEISSNALPLRYLALSSDPVSRFNTVEMRRGTMKLVSVPSLSIPIRIVGLHWPWRWRIIIIINMFRVFCVIVAGIRIWMRRSRTAIIFKLCFFQPHWVV